MDDLRPSVFADNQNPIGDPCKRLRVAEQLLVLLCEVIREIGEILLAEAADEKRARDDVLPRDVAVQFIALELAFIVAHQRDGIGKPVNRLDVAANNARQQARAAQAQAQAQAAAAAKQAADEAAAQEAAAKKAADEAAAQAAKKAAEEKAKAEAAAKQAAAAAQAKAAQTVSNAQVATNEVVTDAFVAVEAANVFDNVAAEQATQNVEEERVLSPSAPRN